MSGPNPPPLWHRYVALGDSGTEGVGDEPYPDGSERGWADRLAELLAAANPRLLYANLAVRGSLTDQVHEKQLAPALALEPDLVTVVAGINDVIRPRLDLDAALAHMDEMLRDLRALDATVVTATFPDVSPINPVARLARRRLRYFNDGVRTIAADRAALLVEAEDFPVLADRKMWCEDRLHLSPEGHRGLAAATARTLGATVDDPHAPGADLPGPSVSQRLRLNEELRWARAFLLPWVHRRLTGRSSGDGRYAKRPQLAPVIPIDREGVGDRGT
ncbi:MAG TPA: SGNH/GDSL hydrolase family protein [Actinomycetota bacterium]|nr:SGNH/GDSL hydrolase family protein [Actinomycetota bacterium]